MKSGPRCREPHCVKAIVVPLSQALGARSRIASRQLWFHEVRPLHYNLWFPFNANRTRSFMHIVLNEGIFRMVYLCIVEYMYLHASHGFSLTWPHLTSQGDEWEKLPFRVSVRVLHHTFWQQRVEVALISIIPFELYKTFNEELLKGKIYQRLPRCYV